MAEYVTIKDVARRAGVHYSTVSLALRDDPRLAKKTRKSIQALAKKMGYVPNAAMKALCAYREGSKPQPIKSGLAYLTNMPRSDPFGSMVYRSARKKAASMGYDLIEFNLNDPDTSLAHFQSIWWHTGINGVLVGPFTASGNMLDCDWDRFIVVAYGYSVDEPRFSRTVLDHYHNMLTHLTFLKSRGYERIGLILSPNLSARTHGLLHSAYTYDQVKHQSARRQPHGGIIDTPEKMLSWVTKRKIDVVVGHENHFSLIQQTGLRVPDDIGFSLVGWKNYPPRSPGALAGFNSKPELLAETSISFLVSQIHENAYGVPEVPKSLLIEGVYHDGKTIRRA